MMQRFTITQRILGILLMLTLFATQGQAQNKTFGNVPPLHVEGKHLKDVNGNIVRLHGVMDTPNSYFNNGRWGNGATDANLSACISYFNKLYTAITDTANGAYCNAFRLHLDPCWTNDNSVNYSYTDENGKTVTAGNTGGGEANIEHFSKTRLTKYMRTLYSKLALNAIKKGLYVIMRPPGVCPETIQVGGSYHHYLLDVWDLVTQNDSILKYSGQISIELANEPIRVLDINGQSSANALHDFFQPIVVKIRANGFTGIIWGVGTGYQSGYEGYATYPLTGYNIGYAVHVYTGWYGQEDKNANAQTFINNFKKQVPVVETNPIVVTEIDWSPQNSDNIKGTNEMGQPVYGNFGTWATGSTSKWGVAWKAVHDHFGNIGMTLTGTGDYIDIDKSIATNPAKAVIAFTDKMKAQGYDDAYEACSGACFEWYKDWNTDTRSYMAYTHQWTGDLGNGTFINPIINGDFPDIDVIRVDDTYYMVSTTMFYVPGATILKSKDLVNWEYCANPLQQIVDNDAYSLLNFKHHYGQGMWASTLNYHAGKFYFYFPCSTWSPDSRSILLTAANPEGKWEVTLLPEAYHDPGWLFDDGPDGDGYLYVACGIGDIYVNKFNAKTLAKLSSTKVLSVGNGCEGSHMYHIGDYYYLYCTYGGTEGSQTIFRSKNPLGPYEERVTTKTSNNPNGRIFAGQKIHQGGLVKTQTGEWWTMMFRDAGAIGRIPYLEPVKWVDGWPVIGNNGRDVSEGGKAYKKPNVGQTYPRTYLPTNDTFTNATLGMQWEWNHNPDNNRWSLLEHPGYLRLYTATVTDSLQWARNSLSQRILGYDPVGKSTSKYYNSLGTIKMIVSNMLEGDIAGIAVFQEPYAMIGVKVTDGKKQLYYMQQSKLHGTQQKQLGAELQSDTIYLRASVNFGTNKANFYYSYDNKRYTKFGGEMNMGYTLDVFVGNRFFLYNYATKQLGGSVDIDWFSTEPNFSEEGYFGPGVLNTFSEADLTMDDLAISATSFTVLPGSSREVQITCTSQSGLQTNVSPSCSYEFSDPTVARMVGGNIIGQTEGSTEVTATYTDPMGNSRSVSFTVSVSYFPLTGGALNPSIVGSGSFVERSGGLKTTKDGFGGWEYTNPADFSDYNYLVVSLTRASAAKPTFRLYDSANINSDFYTIDMKNPTTTVVIDLHDLVTPKGRTLNPSKIYKAGFSTNGTSVIYIKEVFLSMDGVTPALGIGENVKIENVKSESIYDLSGRQILNGKSSERLPKGIYIERQTLSDGTVVSRKVYVK